MSSKQCVFIQVSHQHIMQHQVIKHSKVDAANPDFSMQFIGEIAYDLIPDITLKFRIVNFCGQYSGKHQEHTQHQHYYISKLAQNAQTCEG